MSFDFSFAVRIVPLVLDGIGNTVLVAVLSFVGATALGFFWEILRRSHWFVRPIAQ
ncbi:ABC transporter, partial [Bradyrhizobium sp. CCBAU 21360]|nr:ABC transporter [Bradyrhizobium sp. CCBAU 21360]